jgi:hypothetical protein
MRFGFLLAALMAFAVNAPLPAAAGDIPCSAQQSLRSQNSNNPTQITFVNNTGEGRAILWIGFDGQTKQYAWLNPGENFTVNTFVTHPWMVTNGPGDCIDIYMPRRGPRTIRLGTHESMGGRPDMGPGEGPGMAGAFPIQARSWGGKVRSGPGPNFGAIGSLQEREPIILLGQSDAPLFQNFPWFKIRFRGRIGYQWGGIICGIDAPIPGAFQTCN